MSDLYRYGTVVDGVPEAEGEQGGAVFEEQYATALARVLRDLEYHRLIGSPSEGLSK